MATEPDANVKAANVTAAMYGNGLCEIAVLMGLGLFFPEKLPEPETHRNGTRPYSIHDTKKTRGEQ